MANFWDVDDEERFFSGSKDRLIALQQEVSLLWDLDWPRLFDEKDFIDTYVEGHVFLNKNDYLTDRSLRIEALEVLYDIFGSIIQEVKLEKEKTHLDEEKVSDLEKEVYRLTTSNTDLNRSLDNLVHLRSELNKFSVIASTVGEESKDGEAWAYDDGYNECLRQIKNILKGTPPSS